MLFYFSSLKLHDDPSMLTGSDASLNKLFNFLSLSRCGDKESLFFVSRHGLLIYLSRYDKRVEYFFYLLVARKRGENSKLMLYLLKLTTKKLYCEYDGADDDGTQKREMKWFISRHLPSYDISVWNVQALSIHFHCNWSDHTAIEIVSCGTSRILLLLPYILLPDCFILLITCSLIDTSLTSHEKLCFFTAHFTA